MSTKFKKGDKVVRVGAPLKDVDGTIAIEIGTVLTVVGMYGDHVKVEEESCAMKAERLTPLALYDSPLMKALR